MDGSIVIAMPVHPSIFAMFLAIAIAYLAYSLIKLVVSMWTGG